MEKTKAGFNGLYIQEITITQNNTLLQDYGSWCHADLLYCYTALPDQTRMYPNDLRGVNSFSRNDMIRLLPDVLSTFSDRPLLLFDGPVLVDGDSEIVSIRSDMSVTSRCGSVVSHCGSDWGNEKNVSELSSPESGERVLMGEDSNPVGSPVPATCDPGKVRGDGKTKGSLRWLEGLDAADRDDVCPRWDLRSQSKQ